MNQKIIDVWDTSCINSYNVIKYNDFFNKYNTVCKQLNTGYRFDYARVPQYDLIILLGTVVISKYSTLINSQNRFKGIKLIAECFNIPVINYDDTYISDKLRKEYSTDYYKIMGNEQTNELFKIIKQINPQKTLIIYGSMQYPSFQEVIYKDLVQNIRKFILEGFDETNIPY